MKILLVVPSEILSWDTETPSTVGNRPPCREIRTSRQEMPVATLAVRLVGEASSLVADVVLLRQAPI